MIFLCVFNDDQQLISSGDKYGNDVQPAYLHTIGTEEKRICIV